MNNILTKTQKHTFCTCDEFPGHDLTRLFEIRFDQIKIYGNLNPVVNQ